MIEIPEPGPVWPGDVLARRRELPEPPALAEITTERLVIRPYEREDALELHAVTDGDPVGLLDRAVDAYDPDELVWRFMPAGPFPTSDALAAYLDDVGSRPGSQVLTVWERTSGDRKGSRVGSISLLASAPHDLRIEIGNIFFSPAVQGIGVNREANRAVIEALVALGYQRIEWKCNALNLRSRHAAEALGFTYEGTFRAHMVVKGQRRDTAWYSLVPADDRVP